MSGKPQLGFVFVVLSLFRTTTFSFFVHIFRVTVKTANLPCYCFRCYRILVHLISCLGRFSASRPKPQAVHNPVEVDSAWYEDNSCADITSITGQEEFPLASDDVSWIDRKKICGMMAQVLPYVA